MPRFLCVGFQTYEVKLISSLKADVYLPMQVPVQSGFDLSDQVKIKFQLKHVTIDTPKVSLKIT